MPDGETKRSLTGATAEWRVASAEAEASGLSAIERREARRRATTPMTDEELARWIKFSNEHYEKYGLAGEDYMPI